ncbi:MAG: DUF4364 family protein, partial [Aristaeellaceae bacterium]
ALGPVTGMQLSQFLTQLDMMNYFTMHMSLEELEQQGQIAARAHPLGSLMDITPEGIFTLESFTRRIPPSRRQGIDREASLWRERFRTEQMTPAEACIGPDERSGLRLRLLEGASVLMDVTLTGDDLPQTYLQQRWQHAAQQVYQQVTAMLMAGFSPTAPIPTGDAPALQQAGRGEWMLLLQDRPEKPSFQLLLTFPDVRLARWCLGRWPACCPSLRAMIAAALRSAPV